jgi:hypothetical protein
MVWRCSSATGHTEQRVFSIKPRGSTGPLVVRLGEGAWLRLSGGHDGSSSTIRRGGTANVPGGPSRPMVDIGRHDLFSRRGGTIAERQTNSCGPRAGCRGSISAARRTVAMGNPDGEKAHGRQIMESTEGPCDVCRIHARSSSDRVSRADDVGTNARFLRVQELRVTRGFGRGDGHEHRSIATSLHALTLRSRRRGRYLRSPCETTNYSGSNCSRRPSSSPP